MKGTTVFFICVMLAFAFCQAQMRINKPVGIEKTVTVLPGATYWEYAEEYCPNSMSKGEYVHEIRKLNGMQELVSGEEITILKFEEEER